MTPRYSEGGQEELTLQAPTAVQHASILAAGDREGDRSPRLRPEHEKHLFEELGSRPAVTAAIHHGARSISAEEADSLGFRLFVNGRPQTSGGLLLPFSGGFGQLRCDDPPINAKGDPAKYLNRSRSKAEIVIFGDGEPTHATEGWKDALRLHLELGVTTCGLAGVGHWPRLPASVQHLIYDADASTNPNVWGQLIKAGLARKSLKLAFFPAKIAGPKGGACEFFSNGGTPEELRDLLGASRTGRKLLQSISREWPAEMLGQLKARNLTQLARMAVAAQLPALEAEALVVEDACKGRLKLTATYGRSALGLARQRATGEAGTNSGTSSVDIEGPELQDFIRGHYNVEWDQLRRRVVVDGTIPRAENLKLFYQDLSYRHRIKARKEEARDALEFLAHSNPFNPIARYVEALKQRRQELRLIPLREIGEAFGFDPEDRLSHELLARKLVQQLKRGLSPGYKADEMLILHGAQGDLKSEAIKALAPENDWLAAATEIKETDDWKFLLKVSQCWIYLIDECDKFLRGKDSATLKSILTITSDTYALKGMNEVDGHDRFSTFWGTTNERELFNDHTGVRRWWIACVGAGRRANPGWIQRHRDSIWATAYTWAMWGLESYLPRGSAIEKAAEARAWEASYGLPYEAALQGVLESLTGSGDALPAIAQRALIKRALDVDVQEQLIRNKKTAQDLINDVRRVIEQSQFRTHDGRFRWEKRGKLRLEGFPNPVAGYRAVEVPRSERLADPADAPLRFQEDPIALVPTCSDGVPTGRNGQTHWPDWDLSFLFRPFQEKREVRAMEETAPPHPSQGPLLSCGTPTLEMVGTVGTAAEIDSGATDLPVPNPPPVSEHPSEQDAITAPVSASAQPMPQLPVTSPAHLAANAARSNLTDFQPGDRVYVFHQKLPAGRLHLAVVTKVINAEVHFVPPLEGLLKDPEAPDPEAPDTGAWIPPHPITSISTANCFHELGTTAGVRIENVECDGETWSRLIWQHPDGSTTTREIPPARGRFQPLDGDELDAFLAEAVA